MLNGLKCLVSFDYGKEVFEQMMRALPEQISVQIRDSLKRQPYRAELAGKVIVACKGTLGEVTVGAYEKFVPIVISDILDVVYDSTVVLDEPEGD